MWQFSEAIDGITEACNALGTPITGGNVSFYNETLGKSIYPTPVIGVLGVLEEASRVLKIAFRDEGDIIALLDGAEPAESAPLPEAAREFSSSEYSKTIGGIVAGTPPAIDLAAEKRLIDCLIAFADAGVLQSAHDVSDGGIAVTLAESCFSSKGLGATVALESSVWAEFALFGERGARAVVSSKPAFLADVLQIARQYNVAATQIGVVNAKAEIRIQYNGHLALNGSAAGFRDIWANSLERTLNLNL
jgi:phosphoribosylformylglycinamidine synthase